MRGREEGSKATRRRSWPFKGRLNSTQELRRRLDAQRNPTADGLRASQENGPTFYLNANSNRTISGTPDSDLRSQKKCHWFTL